MDLFRKLRQRLDYGDYQPVKRYKQVYAETLGRDDFVLHCTLLRGPKGWGLRLELVRQWGTERSERIPVTIYFTTVGELRKPFQQLVHDVETGVTQTNVVRQAGTFSKLMQTTSIGSIVRAYGRIDNHPKTAGRQRLELYLAWTGSQYWMVLGVGERGDTWHKFPVGGAEQLLKLIPLLQREMEAEAER